MKHIPDDVHAELRRRADVRVEARRPSLDEVLERASKQASAPSLIEPEVISVMRRAWMAGYLSERRAVQALADLEALPLFRAPHRPLLDRMWVLRANVTPYDAAYIALAETVGVRPLTRTQGSAAHPGFGAAWRC